MIKKLFKDIIIYMPAQLAPAFVGFFSIPIITRIFSTTDYGNYSLVLAIIGPLYIITGWLNMSVIRFYPEYEKKSQVSAFISYVLTLAIFVPLIIGVIFLIIILIFKSEINPQIYNLMLIGIIVFISSAIVEILMEFLRIKGQASWYSAFSIWKSIASITIGLILILFYNFGISGLLIGSLISLLAALPLLLKKIIGHFPFKLLYSRHATINFLKYGLPLAVGNFGAWALDLSDRYLLKIYRTSSEVGIYSASYNISDKTVLLVSSLFLLASVPILIQMWETEGEKQTKEFIQKITRYYLIVIIPLVIALSIFAKPIMNVMTGQEYQIGYKIIPMVALGSLFLGLQQRFIFAFVFNKKTHFVTICLITAGILNIGLNLIFIPKYGYLAAAISTLISYAILLLMMVVFSRKFLIWQFPFKTLVRVFLAAFISGILTYLIVIHFHLSNILIIIFGMFIGLILYILILLIFKEFLKEEINIIKYFFKNFASYFLKK